MGNRLGTDRLVPQRLDELRSRLHQEIDGGILPSCQAAVGLDGEVVWSETFGAADDESRYMIFSCTKALVAGVMWQLFGEGRCSPDDHASGYLDWFTGDGKDDVTIAHLLTHTSGFPHAPLGPKHWADPSTRHERMASWKVRWEPGTQFEYHPTSAHWVLGAIIESIDGRPCGESIRARICTPLGLGRLALGVPAEQQGDIAMLVSVGEAPSNEVIAGLLGVETFDLGEVTAEALLEFNRTDVREVGVPGGGGVSDAADLCSYYQALLHDPDGLWDPTWLTDGTGNVRNTFRNPMTGEPANRTLGLVVAGDDGLSFMRGMGRTVSPRAFGHNGAAGQIAWADPDSGLSFVYLTNGLDQDFLRESRRVTGIASRAGLLTSPP